MSRNAPQFSAPDLLQKIEFEEIDGFAADDLAAAFDAFRRSAEIIAAKVQEQRSAVAPPPSLAAAVVVALGGVDHPGRFFQDWFRPYAIKAQGFVTAYYEVEVDARLSPEPGFTTPILSRPRDLVTLNESPLSLPSGETFTSARRQADGALEPYPDRRAIEEEGA
ncbi:MAG: MltA domain-containing protein, partial [Methylocystis sp.]|nr:MltA domain-containing protein [Methylocystis sp.]